MRIISGSARGTKLNTLEGNNTRPTLDRIKESLFNIIQSDVTNSNFLDLFAGSGAIGIEAASRGANKVVLCDNFKKAFDIIKSNVEKTHMEENVEIYNLSAEKLLQLKKNEKFNLIYIDPPYENLNLVVNSLELILEYGMIESEHLIILETDLEDNILKRISALDLNVIDKRKYGRVSLIFLVKKD